MLILLLPQPPEVVGQNESIPPVIGRGIRAATMECSAQPK